MKRALATVLMLTLSCTVATAAPEAKPAPPVKCPPYTGLKKRIAVLPVVVTATTSNRGPGGTGETSASTWESEQAPGQVGAALTEQLTTALIDTGRFIVLERKALEQVLTEQDLGLSGRANPETAPQAGRVIGAEWLIRAAVTEYTGRKSQSGGGILTRGFGIGGSKKDAYVALDVRIIDAATGQVLDSVKADGKARSSGLVGGLAIGSVVLGAHKSDTTPIGQATREALTDAVDFICQRMEQIPWQSRVMETENGEVTITGGSTMNLQVGQTFTVWHRGKALVDPETGETLGYRETKVGTLQVTQVMDKFSVAEMIKGNRPQRGDVVRASLPAPPPPPVAVPGPR